MQIARLGLICPFIEMMIMICILREFSTPQHQNNYQSQYRNFLKRTFNQLQKLLVFYFNHGYIYTSKKHDTHPINIKRKNLKTVAMCNLIHPIPLPQSLPCPLCPSLNTCFLAQQTNTCQFLLSIEWKITNKICIYIYKSLWGPREHFWALHMVQKLYIQELYLIDHDHRYDHL